MKNISTGQETRKSKVRWIMVAPLLMLFSLMVQIDKTNISVVIADHKFLSDMALVGQPAHVGLLNTLFVSGYGAGMLVWGFVIDRFGPRRSAMLSVCGWALGTFFCALASTKMELYAARTFLGVAEGCLWPLCNSYTGRWFPAREHSRFTGMWIGASFLGIAIGIPIVTVILLIGGWRSVFFTLGLVSFALVPLFYFFGADDPASSTYANKLEADYIKNGAAIKPSYSGAESQVPLLQSLINFRVILVMLCHASSAGILWGLTTWLPTYLIHERGLSFSRMSGVLSFSYVLPIATVILVGFLADRSMQRTWIGAGVAVVTILVLLIAISIPWVTLTTLLLVLAIAAPMIYGGLHSALLHGYVPGSQIARCTGIVMGLGNILGSLSPMVMGRLVGMFGGKFLIAFMLIIGLNLFMLVMYAILSFTGRTTPALAEEPPFSWQSLDDGAH